MRPTITGRSVSVPPPRVPTHFDRGYIKAALNTGQPVDVTSERTNVSRKVLDKNYDARTDGEKREVGKKFSEEI